VALKGRLCSSIRREKPSLPFIQLRQYRCIALLELLERVLYQSSPKLRRAKTAGNPRYLTVGPEPIQLLSDEPLDATGLSRKRLAARDFYRGGDDRAPRFVGDFVCPSAAARRRLDQESFFLIRNFRSAPIAGPSCEGLQPFRKKSTFCRGEAGSKTIEFSFGEFGSPAYQMIC
jgi:hypothetical protein